MCHELLDPSFHADHIFPYSKGGLTVTSNGQALCPTCNLKKGSTVTKLRPWQNEVLVKSVKWLLEDRSDRHFLINAAPGSGKTIAACAIARSLIDKGEIDRVIVIAPRKEVVNQWAKDFQLVVGKYMSKVTGRDGNIDVLGTDICATWAACQGLLDAMQAVCNAHRTLVICDEHHHAAVDAAWGRDADSAFIEAKFVLVLTGTPIRSDGADSIWLAYDDRGAITHPDEGTYTLTYGEAVDLGYCRPTTFHRHEGKFRVDLDHGESIEVNGHHSDSLPNTLARVPALQRALQFYRLACTPQYEPDNETPLASGYQATMVEWGSAKLTQLRNRMPNAGGLVICQSIEMAEYMVKLIEIVDGETPILVHSKLANAESKISAFRNTDKRWLVSVAMVSEGVDIKRLRVLIYLPNALTELSFRQAIGRVVRTAGPNDDTRAYVVMPSFDTFERYARKVEYEMSPSKRLEPKEPTTRRCPACSAECQPNEQTCPACGHEFPEQPERFKTCATCKSLNPVTSESCQNCGESFSQSFSFSLEEALRNGAIARGADLNESEVRDAEEISNDVREKVWKSGDENLLRLIRVLPEESLGRLKNILDA
jgi:superfamily II DNA or RNA helicase